MSTYTERRRSYMTAECLIVQHVAAEPPGLIEEAVVAAGMTARTVRVFAAEPVPTDATGFRGLVVMGGPMGVADVGRLPHLRAEMTLIESALKHDIPVMGVCLGSQLLAAALGSRVTPGPAKEIGWHPVTLLDGGQRDRLLTAAPPRFNAFHWHGDVFDLPPGALALARSERTPLQAFRYGERAYGFLFHLEVTEAIVGANGGGVPRRVGRGGHRRGHPPGRLPHAPARTPTRRTERLLEMGTARNVMAAAILRSVQVGLPRTHGVGEESEPMSRAWTTGFYKEPVVGPVWVGATNLDGDGQADLALHGGPDKAVCVYPAAHYPYWRATLNLLTLPLGSFGENFTVEGLTEAGVCVGDIWTVGEATLQVSQPRQPCWKLARRWGIKDLALRVQQTGRTGWYFRVLREGFVESGMSLTLVERPHPEWTVERANRVMHHDRDDHAAAEELGQLPVLSASWRATLIRRVTQGVQPDEAKRLFGPLAEGRG